MASISRLTRERLHQDDELFNELLPYEQYDTENEVFIHADGSLWSMWELQPKWLTSTSDEDAFGLTNQLQEMLDSLDPEYSVQASWITTYDVEGLVRDSLERYPLSGPAGWMARRWLRMLYQGSRSGSLHRRPKRLRLIVGFRYDPPWRSRNAAEKLKQIWNVLIKGRMNTTVEERKQEYLGYANKFRGVVDGKAAKLADLGFKPSRIDGQQLIAIMYPLLNRRSVKLNKIKAGRNITVPYPTYDPDESLANLISETPAKHPKDGVLIKDGRVYRCVSMVKPPKQMLPLMIAPLQNTPYENIITVTYSKDSQEDQLKRLDALDSTLGRRESTSRGRGNQKVQHQISGIRAMRQELYSNQAQLVRAGIHQVFICQNEEEAIRATSEAIATFPQLHGARGMVHEISDLACMINALPGGYDPATDGAG